jgi:hypothetical protein
LDVEEMLESIPEWKFRRWMAYYQIEPWGEERADLRSAIVASTVANAMAGRRSKKFKPKDFMPFYESAQTPRDHQRILETMAAMMTDKKKKK